MQENIEGFKKKISRYSEAERSKIIDALEWGKQLHADQLRASGEPFFIHPLEVAKILVDMRMDADGVVAGLLHDVMEDTATGREEILGRYGKTVADLVDGMTKISGLKTGNKSIQEAETIRKMLFAMTEDIRVILIKMADKLHNMRTLAHLKPERQKVYAQECLDIFAPLAERLGIGWVKCELEDLSLKTLNRDAFDHIKSIVSQRKDERKAYLQRVKMEIEKAANVQGIDVVVTTRAKHFYSIYLKMRKRGKSAEELYDLLGIRVLCEDRDDCYTLLGIVHHIWKPIDGRFKDYIAMPKANGYQSLHTTVMSYEGRLLEIQIRTKAMHAVAEHGVASHWLYKKGQGADGVKPEDLAIINRLRDWKSLRFSSGEFLDEIKREILKDSIVVFTPKGDAIELPSGATPLDFAYHVHTDVGCHCVAAKADGAIVSLDAELRNTQVIEILTSPQAHPNINWLRTVKTAKARSKIRQWLIQNDQALAIDRYIVARKKGASAEKGCEGKAAHQGERRGTELGSSSADHGERSSQSREKERIVASDEPIIAEVQRREIDRPSDGEKLGISASGDKAMMIRIAGCCRPSPGDEIVGYVSRGRGIIVHRRNCRNIAKIPDFTERRIDVEWEKSTSAVTRHFKVTARRSYDLFSEIEGAIRKHKGHLIEGRLQDAGSGRLSGAFTMELERKEDLKKIIKNIQGIPSIISIQPV